MNEQRNNGKGVFYGVIGVATLVVAIIGATFAYFTASASNNTVITGNMATVKLTLAVEKVVTVDEDKGGMIPMSNGMVEAAVNNAKNEVCVDDNGNAVCQVYKITLTNSSSAGQFVDGYVSLKGGSAAPTDYTEYVDGAKFKVAEADTTAVGTTMRWAQVFVGDGKDVDDETDPSVTNGAATTDYSTAGVQTLGAASETIDWSSIGNANDPHSAADLRDENALMETPVEGGDNVVNAMGVLEPLTIAGTSYDVIGTNYIRVSNHDWSNVDANGNQTYDREDDVTSALVFNHSIAAGESATYYIVVWLSETGTNQTAGVTNEAVSNPAALKFFNGNVTFLSAQGSEVSATFSGYSRVSSQNQQAEAGA